MKQQELKEIKRQLLDISKSVTEKYQGVPDEDAQVVCGELHHVIASLVNRIENKYKKVN